jgi:GntR family transcriptional repressor for pyruvate dehydrogenase complex
MTGPHDSNSPFSRANRSDLPSMLADEIRNWIAAGKLIPGDKLPTERELCEKYEVSRIVVREAMSRLRHEGLAVAHQGKGVFVAYPEDSRFLQISEQSISRPEDYRKLYELRLVLETGAVSLAAEHREDKDLDALQSSLEAMRTVENLEGSYVAADIGFHRAVSAAAKNPFLSIMTSFVDARLRESIALAIRFADFVPTVEITLAEHMAIFASIRDRDPNGAADAMRLHLNNASRRLGL